MKKPISDNTMEQDNQSLNNLPSESEKPVESNNKTGKPFFLDVGVEKGCHNHLKIIFDTLLLQKKCIQQDLADSLGVDKSFVSRIVNGIEIPNLKIRLKIAMFFGVDSSLIWRYEDLPYIKKLIAKQGVENESN